jgi:uncharacterized protein YqjF (DUF2071 family)
VNETIAFVNASVQARSRLLSTHGEPLFHSRWDRAVFIHYECDPETLQKYLPFPLDLYNGRAFVSVVAFTMQKMRPRLGGAIAAWLFKPIATHYFLNLRSYVKHKGEPGIYFMAEWLSNRLSVLLGPVTFGLPYRFGQIEYRHNPDAGELEGRIASTHGTLEYCASPAVEFDLCEPGSVTEFLLERYTAYTCAGGRKRFFRVWHEPWQQAPLQIASIADDMLSTTGSWWSTARYSFGNYSPGVDVWMGWPHRFKEIRL